MPFLSRSPWGAKGGRTGSGSYLRAQEFGLRVKASICFFYLFGYLPQLTSCLACLAIYWAKYPDFTLKGVNNTSIYIYTYIHICIFIFMELWLSFRRWNYLQVENASL